MTAHDPLCHHADPDHFPSITFDGTPFPCDCPLIAQVRADERSFLVELRLRGDDRVTVIEAEVRERIAQEIEALPTTRTKAWDKGWDSVSLAEVLRIARGGAQ